MRIAIDTNVLAYAEGLDGPVRQSQARAVMQALGGHDVIVPTQVLGELFNVLTRKGGRNGPEALRDINIWREALQIASADAEVMSEALALAAAHRLQIWDCLILATSAAAGCSILLSENMQDGFTWAGVTVANPFSQPANPLLSALFDPF